MDRLSPLMLTLIAALLSHACGDEPAAPIRQRVVAVKADPGKALRPEDFCDIHQSADLAKGLAFPPLEKAPAPPSGGWRWINVWATWCRPCIEEMPRLLEWRERLSKEGTQYELLFLSVDESAEVMERFLKNKSGTPSKSLRLSEQEALPGWIAGLGLDPGATLPLQVFVDSSQKVRCVRSGSVNESHLDVIEQLLSSR